MSARAWGRTLIPVSSGISLSDSVSLPDSVSLSILNGPLYRLRNLLGTRVQNKLVVSDALELVSPSKSRANRASSKATRLFVMKE